MSEKFPEKPITPDKRRDFAKISASAIGAAAIGASLAGPIGAIIAAAAGIALNNVVISMQEKGGR